jgi:hypothetical protein
LKHRCKELDADEQAEFRLIRQRIPLVVHAIALLTLPINLSMIVEPVCMVVF